MDSDSAVDTEAISGEMSTLPLGEDPSPPKQDQSKVPEHVSLGPGLRSLHNARCCVGFLVLFPDSGLLPFLL